MKRVYLLPIVFISFSIFTTYKLDAQCTMTASISLDAPNPGVVCEGELITFTANVTGGTGPFTYSWSNGTNAPSFSVEAPFFETAILIVTDSEGCTAFASLHAKVNVLDFDINFSAFPTCQGDTVALIIATTAEQSNTNYLWSTGETTNIIYVTTSGTYSATMTNPGVPCVASNSATITILPVPTPVPQILGPSTICPGETATLSINGGPFSSYNWSNGDNQPSIQISDPGLYTVYVENAEGCLGIDELEILPGSISPELNAPAPLCPGQSTILEVTNATEFETFQWSNGGNGPSITVITPGNYTVTVTATGGCTATASAEVTNTATTFSVTGTATQPTGGQNNGDIDISVLPSGSYTYIWSNGATTEDLTGLGAGSYSVTVSAGAGCTEVASFTLNSFPCSGFNGGIADPGGTYCLGLLTLESIVIGGTAPFSYNWSTGGTGATESINLTGALDVTLTVTDATGCTFSHTLHLKPFFWQQTVVIGPPSCEGQPVQLMVDPDLPFFDYLWSTGATSSSVFVTSPGNYSVTISDGPGGCTKVVQAMPSFLPGLPVSIDGPATLCPGQSATLSAVGGPFTSYLWSPGGQTSPNITVNGPGAYSLTVGDGSGCEGNAQLQISPEQINPPQINAPATLCSGGIAMLDILNSGEYASFFWNTGETTSSINMSIPETYNVTVTASSGCTSVGSVTVSLDPNAPVAFADVTAATCGQANGAVNLTVSPPGTYNYLWSNGAVIEDLSGVGAGSYFVTVTTPQGCTATTNALVPDAPLNVSLNGTASPVTSCTSSNGSIVLNPSPSGNYSFTWSNGATAQNLSNLAPGIYSVTLSAGGTCTATEVFTIGNNATPPTASTTVSPVTSCASTNGGVDLTISPSGNYTFVWSNGATTEDLQNIAAGNFSVTITAGNGCTTTAAAEVVNNATGFNLSATPSANNSCAFANGAIDLSYSPLGNYTFIWSNGATTEDLQNIAAGSYGVTVTATASGCTNVGSYTVVENAVIPLATATPTAATCGQANGSASLSVTPAGTYNYMWTNGSTAANLQNVVAGVYDVTVTGANGCSATATAEVTENTTSFALTATPTANNSCVSANGSIDLSTSPSGNYTYIWSNGATTEDLQGIAAGSYTVTVTAGGNCSSTASYTVPDDSGAPALAATTAPSVCGENNGNVDITASPTGNYDFIWTNGATSEDLQNIAAGNYTVTVTDANGCSSTATATVADNTLNFTANGAVSANTSCTASNGSIELAMSLPGTYNFLWSNGATSQNLQNLPAGSYAVTVTQGITCLTTADYIVQEESGTPAISTAINPANCGQTNGSISLNVSPATGNSFQWSNGETTQSLQNIAAGNYEVTCTGANGCTVSEVITVPSESTDISLSAQPSGNSSCINPDGVIDLTISSTTTYDILWSNGATTEDLNSLPAGSYTVTVTDADGCSESAAYLVPGPAQPSVAVAGPASACQGTAATLSAGGGFSSYLWSNGATTSSISVSQTGTYAVTATDVNGCTATANSNFQNLPIPMPGISGPSSICGGDAVFSITGGNFPQIIWSNGATSQSITISQPAIYSVTVTNPDGCTGVASQELSVGSSLLPVIATDATNCDGTASLDAGAGYASYLWSNGSTTQTLSVNANGTYAVTVSDGTGCTGSGTTNLSIPTPPQVQISGASSICQGTGTQFSVPNNFPQIIWSTGATTSVITDSQAGTYSVTVTTADGCTATGSQVLTVAPGLSPDISATLVDCGGTFTLEVSGSFANYLWSNGSTASAIIVSTGGNYAVTVSDLAGCTGTASETVTPPQPPIVQIAGAATLCQSDQTDLVAPGDFVQYLWNTGETGPQITISQGGIYGVTVSDANGCTASAEWSVTALLSEIVVVETTACSPQDTGTVTVVLTNQFGCDSTVVTATVLAQPVFSTIEMSACAGETAVFNGVEILAGGSQEFIFTGTNGCDSIVYVNVSQLPAVDFGLTAEKTCHNSSDGMVEVTMLGGKAPYQYSLDSGPFQSQPIFTNLSGGSYAVMVEDGNGCVLEQNITVPETLPLEIFTADDTLSCEVGEATLRPLLLSGNAGEVEWTWPDGSQLPWLTVDEAGTYKVVADDGCEVVERAIQVVWDEEYRKTDFFYVPNTFSPNGDGINDLFQVFPGRNFEMVSFEFRVFDRWGDAMFITFDPAEGWDGVYRDIQRQPAVYVWFVKAKVMVCGAREVDVFKEGGVTIMR